jgi:hypothetical protein
VYQDKNFCGFFFPFGATVFGDTKDSAPGHINFAQRREDSVAGGFGFGKGVIPHGVGFVDVAEVKERAAPGEGFLYEEFRFVGAYGKLPGRVEQAKGALVIAAVNGPVCFFYLISGDVFQGGNFEGPFRRCGAGSQEKSGKKNGEALRSVYVHGCFSLLISPGRKATGGFRSGYFH